MKEITKITSQFFPTAETVGRKRLGNTNAIASQWTICLTEGSKQIKKKYNITLLDDSIDSYYSSQGNPIKKYFIQIDDSQKEKKRTYPICPKIGKGTPIFYYLISEHEFSEFDFSKFFIENSSSIQKIADQNSKSLKYDTTDKQDAKLFNRDDLGKRIKDLDLNQNESKTLFFDVFQKYLIDNIKKEDPSIDVKNFSKTEAMPLLNDLNDENDSIKKIFCKMLCCCNCE